MGPALADRADDQAALACLAERGPAAHDTRPAKSQTWRPSGSACCSAPAFRAARVPTVPRGRPAVAYSELHDDDETAPSVTAFTRRPLDFYLCNGVVGERLMADNAFAYISNRRLRELLRDRAIPRPRDRSHPAPALRLGSRVLGVCALDASDHALAELSVTRLMPAPCGTARGGATCSARLPAAAGAIAPSRTA